MARHGAELRVSSAAMKHRILRLLACMSLATAVAVASGLEAEQISAPVISDPEPDPANPASMEAPDVPSHGSRMRAVLYLAAGADPHPTVLLMHGFPGNEQNMDLAYAMQRAGWNVLAPHYRGSWGSEGAFSFTHAIEDTQSAVQFLRDTANANKYRIDPKRVVLIGHSMGGFAVALVAATDPAIMGVGLIAAANLGPSTLRASAQDPEELRTRFQANASRVVGSRPEELLEEATQNAITWNYLNYASALSTRPVLIVEADDRNTSDNQALASVLGKLGNSRVTETHIATDHVFSGRRIALQGAVVQWLQAIGSRAAK